MEEARDCCWIDIVLAIVAAAIVTYGVLILGWSVFVVIALFWFENVVIGVLNLAKIGVSGARVGGAGLIAALALGAFFTVHYGMFTVVHGVFVAMLFGQPELNGSLNGLFSPLGRMLAYLFADRDGWLAAVAIVVLQAAAFIRWSSATRMESFGSDLASLPALMFAPYGRIVILHVTIIASGVLVAALKLPLLGALLLVVLKLAFDIAVTNKPATPRGSARPIRWQRFTIAQEDDATRP